MKRFLHYENFGDYDARRREMYWHHAAIPLEVGSTSVSFRRWSASVEILSVAEDSVTFRFRGSDYTLTGKEKVHLEERDRQCSDDGPWYTATDEVRFTFLEVEDGVLIAEDKKALRRLIEEHSADPHYAVKTLFYAVSSDYEDLMGLHSFHYNTDDKILRVAQIYLE